MVVNIISFAGGANCAQYTVAGKRLMKQAWETGVFDKNILYTEEYLKQDPEFWPRHQEFIKYNPRGYGYYIWKPYLIKKTMEQMQDGDKLFWLDSVCEIDKRNNENLLKYLKYVETDYIIGSRNGVEREWSKIDLILRLNMLEAKYLENLQRQANAILLLVCDKTRALVNEWYDICCDYHFLDDSSDTHERLRGFKEHRHDQSIFSLLTKKHNLFSEYEIENAAYVFRNNTGTSWLKQG
jgi:hypothetical protein